MKICIYSNYLVKQRDMEKLQDAMINELKTGKDILVTIASDNFLVVNRSILDVLQGKMSECLNKKFVVWMAIIRE